jgi:peptidoglycan/LPS O-acetylase OafA/YrhL
MVGSLAAQLVAFGTFHKSMIEHPVFRLALLASIGSLTTLILTLEDRRQFLFDGGYTIVALVSAVIVLHAAFAERGVINGVLRHKWLVYVGQRSYALYLWHYPIGYWLRDLGGIPELAAAVLLSFAAAELSYRVVERPALAFKSRVSSHRAELAPQNAAAVVAPAA